MKKFTKFIGLLLMGVFIMSGCGTESEDVAKTGSSDGSDKETKTELVWGTNAEFPPYEYKEGGKVVGIDAEIVDAIAKKLNMESRVEDMNFDSIVASVQSGKIDIGVAGMTAREDRAKMVNFTIPYTTATQSIIVKEGSPIKSADDLKGKTVGVQLGTTGADYVSSEIEGVTVENYNKGSEAVIALTQDKIDAVVIDNEPAKKFVEANQGLVVLEKPLTTEEYAIAVAKENTDLLEKINTALAELKESGELQKIIDRYITAE